MKFEDGIDEFLDYLSIKIKPTTLLFIKRKLNNHIIPYFKGKYINNINYLDYINWQKEIIKLGFSKTFNNHVYIVIKKYFDYLNLVYDIENIPLKYGKILNNINNRKIIKKTLNLKQFKKFIKNINDPIYHALFNTLYFTGIRKGELLALTFKDLNDDYIYINKTITKEYFNGKKLITSPKSEKSIRYIKIDYFLRKELKKLKKYYKKKYNDYSDNFYIFGGIKSIPTTTLDRKKDYYFKLSNIDSISIHEFRHSHATLLYEKNINIKYIQYRLGHQNIETTLNTYIHVNNKYEKRVLNTLNFLRIK